MSHSESARIIRHACALAKRQASFFQTSVRVFPARGPAVLECRTVPAERPDADRAMHLFRPDERRHSRRFDAQLPARLDGILVYSAGEAGDDAGGNLLRLACRTRDVSEAGLALVVPAARLDERFLPRESCLMLVLLELPGGQVALEAAPMHHQLVRSDDGEPSYLVGASIRNISERDRALYLAFLDALTPAV